MNMYTSNTGKSKFLPAAMSCILGAGALAGVAKSALDTVIDKFYGIALDRKFDLVLPVFGTDTIYKEQVYENIDWLKDNITQDYSITSADGLELVSHLLLAPDAKRTMIMVHGWRGTWDTNFALAGRCLYENSCNMLFLEMRGQGQSAGRYMTMGVKEYEDVLEWVKWYVEYVDSSLPIYLYGVSMGAFTSLMTADKDMPPQVKGIIADSGFSNPYDMIKDYGKREYHLPEYPFVWALNRRVEKELGFSLKSCSATEAVAQAKLPILFFHGTNDNFVLCENTMKNYEACTSEKDLVLIEGAGHCESYITEPEKYKEALLKFLEKHDGTHHSLS